MRIAIPISDPHKPHPKKPLNNFAFEEKYGTLEYDPAVPCITASFNEFMSSEQFRSFLNKGLDLLIEKKKIHGKILWLADTRKHVVQPEKDTTWVAEDWNVRALKAGIRHVAFVLPVNAFGGAAVKTTPRKTRRRKTR